MIVGAGVVGSYLGKILGNQEIWEAKSKHSEKVCGGLFSKNIKKLNIDLSESLLNEVKGAKFYSENENFVIESNKTQAYVVNRFNFEKNLIQDAVNEGCKIKYGKQWKNENDDFIIGADGALSAVAKSCNLKRNFIHSYQETITLEEKKNPDFVELHFSDDFAPGFFAWYIPFNEKQGKLGLGCSNGNPAEYFQLFKKKFEIKKAEKPQSALIPLFDKKKTVFGNKALVGDAAAQVKATTGGGVVFGCLCANELKKAIDKNDLQSYENNWRDKYENQLKTHKRVWKYYRRVDKDKLFNLVKEKEIDKVLSEHGDMEDTDFIKKYIFKNPALMIRFGLLI